MLSRISGKMQQECVYSRKRRADDIRVLVVATKWKVTIINIGIHGVCNDTNMLLSTKSDFCNTAVLCVLDLLLLLRFFVA